MAKRGAADNARPARRDLGSPDDHSRSPHRDDQPGQPSPLHKPKASRARRAEEPASPKVPDWPRVDCTPEEFRQAFIGITTDLLGQISAVSERVDTIQGRGYDSKIVKLELNHKDLADKLIAASARLDAVNPLPPHVEMRIKDLDDHYKELRKNLDHFGRLVADDAGRKEGHIERLAKLEIATEEYVAQLQTEAKNMFQKVDGKFKMNEREYEKLQAEHEKLQAELMKSVKTRAGSCAGYSSAVGSCTGYSSTAGHTAGPPRSLGPDLGAAGDDFACRPCGPPGVPIGTLLGAAKSPSHECHCFHLDELAVKVESITAEMHRRAAQPEPPIREPPSVNGSAPATAARPVDSWQTPGACPWSAGAQAGGQRQGPGTGSIHPGQGGGAGAPGGSGGGGGGGGDAPHGNAAVRHVGPAIYDLEKIFDDKVALSETYKFVGGEGGERWRMKIRGYWIARFPALQSILNWAEDMGEKRITFELVSSRSLQGQWMTEASVPRLSELLWGFMNTCLAGEAHTCFETADTLNGLEAWRLIVRDIQKGKTMRMCQLRKLIRNPPQITRLEDVDHGLIRFENLHKEYAGIVGDRAPHDDEKRTDLLECLPAEIREQLLWRSTVEGEDFQDFQNHVRAATNSILYHRGKIASPINAVDSPETNAKSHQQTTEKLNEVEQVIGAVLKKMGFQPGKQDFRQGPPRGPGATRRPIRCANCNAEGHMAKECTKARVDAGKRLCYECGKPGHIARDCRTKGSGSVRMVEDEDCTNFFGNVSWQTVPKRSGSSKTAGFPTPRTTTLGDFVPVRTSNKFEVLATAGEGPKKSQKQWKKQAVLVRDIVEAENKEKRERSVENNKNMEKMMVTMNEPNDDERIKTTTPAATAVSGDPLASLPSTGRPGYSRAARTGAAGLKRRDGITGTGSIHGCPTGTGSIHKVSLEEVDIPLTETFLGPCYYDTEDEEEENPDEILAATDEVEIEVAIDSGAVAHVAGPSQLPGSITVEQPEHGKLRNFVAANNGKIKNFGKANVRMELDTGTEINNTFQVADVSRPLHSVGVIADTKKEVLFTRGEAVVVPEGALSKFLGAIRQIAKYPRKGGLYVARMKAKNPNPKPKPTPASTFGRQGPRR